MAPAATATTAESEAPAPPPAPEFKPQMLLAPLVIFGLRYLKVDLSDYVQELRIAFGLVVVLNLLASLVIYRRAQSAADADTRVVVKEKVPGKPTVSKEMTYREYDSSQVMKKVQSSFVGLAITGFIHYKWGNATPLLLQALMIPLNAIQDPLFEIHILGKEAVGKLKRPFATHPNPLEELMGGGSSQDTGEEAAKAKETKIEAAPKSAARRGKKDKKQD